MACIGISIIISSLLQQACTQCMLLWGS